MGEEFAATSPFLFFCDFGGDLATAVREGRRAEFERFEKFRDAKARAAIPDPTAVASFEASRLKWSEVGEPGHKAWHEFYRELLQLRQTHLGPRLASIEPGGSFSLVGQSGLQVAWRFADGVQLHLAANFSAQPSGSDLQPHGRIIHASHAAREDGGLDAWATVWSLEPPEGAGS
jgi:1,4-alpha-glucan branching enzyme